MGAQIIAIQELLTNPNPKSPAQQDAYYAYINKPAEYVRKVKEQALRNKPTDETD